MCFVIMCKENNNFYSKLRLLFEIYIYIYIYKFLAYNYSGYIPVAISRSNGQWSWRVCSVWSGCTKWQVFPQQVFSDTSLPVLSWPVTQAKRTSLSLHSSNSGIEKDDAFSTSTIYFIFYFFIKAVFELKNPGCRFLLCLFFFDSLSCLVSPLFLYSPFRLSEWQIEREMLDFSFLLLWENNWHTVVRPRAHWVMRAISLRSL